jgi:hypothetical protein
MFQDISLVITWVYLKSLFYPGATLSLCKVQNSLATLSIAASSSVVHHESKQT